MIDESIIAKWLECGSIISKGNGKLLMGWGERRWLANPAIATDSPSFYFPDFFLKDSKPWFVHEYHIVVSPQELASRLQFFRTSSRAYEWHNPHHNIFKETFDHLQQQFASGEFDKAVAFAIETTPVSMNAPQLAKSLLNILTYVAGNPVHLYGFWEENAEGILGATPEILFRLIDNGTKLQTVACAGTLNITSDHAAFLNDPKELHEHRVVVQGITESLSPFGKVEVGDLQLLTLPRLAHLITPISIQFVKMPTFEEVVRALHPTPAVGAFPKQRGIKWLEELQSKIDRNRFGAPVGYLFPSEKIANCYVSIRNVQWNCGKMELAAGCGIVKESQCDREWAEINLKLRAIKEMLAL